MRREISLEEAVSFTKSSVYLAHSWPPSRILTKWESIKLDIFWYLSLASALGLLLPLLMFIIYEHQSTFLILTHSICFAGAICNFIIKMIVYRIQRDRTQILINEMEDFLKTAEPHERKLLQRYVNGPSTFHIVIIVWNYMATAAGVCAPWIFPQEYRMNAIYPFSLDYRFVRYATYIHRGFVSFQCSTGSTIDCQAALMMWYASARLELLANELKNVFDLRGFRIFVRKHVHLLWYANEVSHTMRYIAFTTLMMNGLVTILSGFQILSNQPFVVKMLFGPVVLIATMNLFVCSWAADNMIQVCHKMATAAYNASWINLSPSLMKHYLMILHRSQRPVVVSIGGFLPVLSLRFYAMYLSSAFSYTMTLRLVIDS